LHQEGEYPIEVGRSLRALVSLGLYHRPFEDRRDEWQAMVAQRPSIGYFPAETFDPDSYRGNRKLPTHVRMTERDAYWGAKVVTSFSDQQLAAVVATARLFPQDAAYIEHALRVRRDIIGRRYLRATAAVENPVVTDDGAQVCFQDLAIARGYAAPGEVRYLVAVGDGHGKNLSAFQQAATGDRACLPFAGDAVGSGYRVVRVAAQLAGAAGGAQASTTKAARIHLRWRAGEHRFVVVGLERDE